MTLSKIFKIILHFIHSCNQILWGSSSSEDSTAFPGILLILLLMTHLFFTIRLRFVQRHVWKGIRYSVTRDETHPKNSPFASLATILAATIGIGNIVGVSTAIALGGPGAVFWCWLTGILGMATSYAECYLSLFYRRKKEDGSMAGGPMYVLHYGLHCVPLAILFALFTTISSLGVGCTIQSNAAAAAAQSTFHISPLATGTLFAVLSGFVLIGGTQTIRKLCEKLVPAMGVFFLLACLFILLLNRDYIFKSICLILESAFLPKAAAGGFVGSTFLTAARFGVARGLFTNEAGLGSAPIAAASTPAEEGDTGKLSRTALISMTAVFWDTIVLCAITGIAIVSHIIRYPNSSIGLLPTDLTNAAFASIPYIGTPMLALSTIAFSFATILGWYYFGEHAFRYLLDCCDTLRKRATENQKINENHKNPGKFPQIRLQSVNKSTQKKNPKVSSFQYKAWRFYQILYLVMIFFGAIQSSELIWELTDFINACMAFPNLLCLLLLFHKIPCIYSE